MTEFAINKYNLGLTIRGGTVPPTEYKFWIGNLGPIAWTMSAMSDLELGVLVENRTAFIKIENKKIIGLRFEPPRDK